MVDTAEVIQSYLKEVGIKANIKQLEWSAYKDAINKGEPDMFWLGWFADYPDPENFSSLYSTRQTSARQGTGQDIKILR